jgi:hypothetical protein
VICVCEDEHLDGRINIPFFCLSAGTVGQNITWSNFTTPCDLIALKSPSRSSTDSRWPCWLKTRTRVPDLKSSSEDGIE